jgi:hypothetical protein
MGREDSLFYFQQGVCPYSDIRYKFSGLNFTFKNYDDVGGSSDRPSIPFPVMDYSIEMWAGNELNISGATRLFGSAVYNTNGAKVLSASLNTNVFSDACPLFIINQFYNTQNYFIVFRCDESVFSKKMISSNYYGRWADETITSDAAGTNILSFYNNLNIHSYNYTGESIGYKSAMFGGSPVSTENMKQYPDIYITFTPHIGTYPDDNVCQFSFING